MEFDTKIALIVRDDLLTWQKLNVTAFITSGLTSDNPGIIGKPYLDAGKTEFSSLARQPIIILSATESTMSKIHNRALNRNVKTAAYIEEMFSTGDDEANRAVFAEFSPKDARIVGLGIYAQKKIVDKICKGAKMHT